MTQHGRIRSIERGRPESGGTQSDEFDDFATGDFDSGDDEGL